MPRKASLRSAQVEARPGSFMPLRSRDVASGIFHRIPKRDDPAADGSESGARRFSAASNPGRSRGQPSRPSSRPLLDQPTAAYCLLDHRYRAWEPQRPRRHLVV
ncbi:hypothetical protein QIS74_04787 [Colletotrichum tabaci]|uniref:Uncharacterized protein n=1 Tax=Colletotrichum tabaci TaxID=1209068 RepID=A0AAV9THF4_9PEZI